MIELRPYQREAIDSIYRWFETQGGDPVLVLPTGSGKSAVQAAFVKEIFERWPGQRILLLVHVKELVSQNFATLKRFWPEAAAGIYSAGVGRREADFPIVVAGIQSVYRKAHELGERHLVIIDECFTGETLISTVHGEKRIDEIEVGETVINAIGFGRVRSVFSKETTSLMEVRFSNEKTIRCTKDHPFFTNEGWKEAEQLERGEGLFGFEDVYSLWRSVLPVDEGTGEWLDNNRARKNLEKEDVLLDLLLKEAFESHVQPCNKNENETKTSGNKTLSYPERWEREASFHSCFGAFTCLGGGMGSRICSSDEEEKRNWLSNLLQAGFSKCGKEDRNRSEWKLPFDYREKGSGFKKNCVTSRIWVEDIRRIELKSPRTVFNLRVSGHPSYFADGILVHNCHRIPPTGAGMYQTLLTGLRYINPHLRLIGLTATPYRMGQGYQWDGEDALFDGPSYQIDMGALIRLGYLSPLTTAPVVSRANLSQVKTRQGDFVEGDLERAMDSITDQACREMVDIGSDRRKWIVFCVGVSHAENVTRTLRDLGVTAELVTGETPNEIRDAIVDRFRAGEIRALVNVMVLTTGFDVPDVDMLVFLRPTMSPGLFVQMAGRGTRLAEGKTDCLILDFARNLDRHGPVDKIGAPSSGTGEPGEAPTKNCPACGTTMYAGATTCPSCGLEMPRDPEKKLTSRASDAKAISDDRPERRAVFGVSFSLHRKEGKPDSMRVEYDCGLQTVRQWICPHHGDYARYKAEKWWARHIESEMPASIGEMIEAARMSCRPITTIWTKANGKFEEVIRTEIGERHAVMSAMSEIPF